MGPIRRLASAWAASAAAAAAAEPPAVEVLRLPDGFVQPATAVAPDGTLHVVCLSGPPETSDVEYLRLAPGAAALEHVGRVNTTPASATAAGAIRGAQIVLGDAGRVHVVWNGAPAPGGSHDRLPLYYTRLDSASGAFEPQRNLVTRTRALDGGATLTADAKGGVLVAWHAADPAGSTSESDRRVYAARSADAGATFGPEEPISGEPWGACACCGMAGTADPQGRAVLLYRRAVDGTERDLVLLRQHQPGAAAFASTLVEGWVIPACPMSSGSAVVDPRGRVLLAWETRGQVRVARCAEDGALSTPFSPPEARATRKHPRAAADSAGRTLLAWAERSGGKRAVAWQAFDEKDAPIDGAGGRAEGLAMWGTPGVAALPGDRLVVIY